ncbi:hypothetical protein [uncultured Rhodoblastus sp.]|uniref:hypothetical protein n=1 Tax=uncultured Rhodoblastus sp. TaxID=543037 RepID=UPI0025DA90AC|nr:hypothetical protein [uncultured Rhodoblastus sp.]
MNRIVKAHYPVSALPEDLRQGFDPDADVTVIVEESDRPENILSIEELFAARRPPFRSAEEIDRQIRQERDGWND